MIWSDAFQEPIASRLRDGEWQRILLLKDDSWAALGRTGQGPPVWHRILEDRVVPVPPETDAGIKGLQPAISYWKSGGWEMELLAHRIGSRAVYGLRRGAQRSIGKVYRKNRDVLLRWQSIPHSDEFRTPSTLAWHEDWATLEMQRIPGRTLHVQWATREATSYEASRWGRMLEWLRQSTASPDLPAYGFADEQATLTRMARAYESAMAEPDPRILKLVDRARKALDEAEPGELVLCHRDLHDKQVLDAGHQWFLLDLDLVCRGPSMLDAGNLVAHFRLRSLQLLQVPWQEMVAGVVEAMVSPTRDLWRWTAATLVRLALLYSLRKHRAGVVAGLTDSAESALDRRGEWHDLLDR